MQTIPVHDFSSGSAVSGFGIEQWNPLVPKNVVGRPHRHNYFEALFFIRGKGQHEIDFKTYEFKPLSVHFVPAASVHVVKRQPGSAGFSILFSPEFLPPAITAQQFDFFKSGAFPVLDLGKENFAELNPFLATLQNEYTGSRPMKREALQAVFQVLMVQLQRFYILQSGNRVGTISKNEFMLRFEALIEKNHLQHWRAGKYAAALNMSVNNLSSLTKKYYSVTAQQLVHQRLLLEIKRRLAYSDKPVKEICFDLNFEDPAYFNRFFKTHTGLTPQQYREALNE